ncbi:MAG: VWA domain-containing protein [Synergistaceae bacterium]|nr:VWA domain-containing protein [Synergistaceae bacterium]
MSRKISFMALLIAVFWMCGGMRAFASESVVLEVGADTPAVVAGKTHRVIARALVRPSEEIRRPRAPIAAALVIDKSGSMGADGKMENAKRGAMEALRSLGNEDYAAVIAYDTKAFVLVKTASVRELGHFEPSISRLRPEGNTALYDGVKLSAKEIARFAEKGYIPRIILLSDGLANVGPSSARELAALGRELSRRELTITTIGLGLDYDEDTMTALASESGGNAYFAKTSDSLEDIFRRDMQDAVAITGRQVRVTLSCGENVKPIRALGREGKTRDAAIEVDIDNLYGSEKYAIFELEVPASEKGTTLRAGTVKVEYTDAATGSTVTLESPLSIEYTEDESRAVSLRNVEITSQAEMARNAEILETAVKLADEGKSEEASEMLKERADYLANPEYALDEKAKQDAEYISSLASGIAEQGEMSNEQRKSSVNRAYAAKNQQSEVTSRDARDTD